jgi:hypothetical protein
MRIVVEVIGLIGLIASLGFVGLEIRQNTMAVRAATIQAVSDQAMELTLSMATDEQLPRLVYEMRQNGVTQADLSNEDRLRLRLAVVAGLRRQENLYLQVENGALPSDALKNVSFSFYRNPFVRELWASDRQYFDPDFATYWDEILAD